MAESPKCPQCGTPLAANAPGGLCPACLLKRGLEANTAGFTAAESRPESARWTPPAPEDLAPRFPELDILELIGRGGMGAVYKARQKNLNRVVALKILPPEIGRDPAFAERFAREAQAMARLSHPHIVAIHDFGEREGLYFFLMEYVDGLNLRQLHEFRRRRAQGGAGHRAADLRRPPVCPRPGDRPPRHQAREHPARPARAGQDRRLRPGQTDGPASRLGSPGTAGG